MLGMFNIMEHYRLYDEHRPHSPLTKTRTGLNMHRITEAMKFAFGARTEISDPDTAYMDEKRRERVTGFAQRGWADEIVKELTDVSPLSWCHVCGSATECDLLRTPRILPSTTIPSSMF